jgi:hypothetical protein
VAAGDADHDRAVAGRLVADGVVAGRLVAGGVVGLDADDGVVAVVVVVGDPAREAEADRAGGRTAVG